MQTRMESAEVEDETLAKQIESQVIDDMYDLNQLSEQNMYKTTIEQFKSRRDRYMGGLEDTKTEHLQNGAGAEPPKMSQAASQGYKSYLEECRREYRQEKDEKIRNKSFEFDRSVKNGSFSQAYGEHGLHSSAANILPSSLLAEKPLLTNGQSSLVDLGVDRKHSQNGTAQITKSQEHSHHFNANKELTVNIRQEIKNKSGLGYGSALALNRSQSPRGNFDPLKPETDPKMVSFAFQQSLAHKQELGLTGPEKRPAWSEDYTKSSEMPPRRDQKTHELLVVSSDTATIHFPNRKHSNELKLESLKKQTYEWGSSKAVDPFEDKHNLTNCLGFRFNLDNPYSERIDRDLKPRQDESKLGERGLGGFNEDRNYRTERDKRRTSRSRSPDIGPSPSVYADIKANLNPAKYGAAQGQDTQDLALKCRRLEGENSILLKNNSELRKENMDLKEKLNSKTGGGSNSLEAEIQKLSVELKLLKETNKRLESQLLKKESQTANYHNFPDLSGQKTSGSNQKQPGKLLSSSREEINGRGGANPKNFAETDRGPTRAAGFDRDNITKVKFADRVLDMTKQLLGGQSTPDPTEECKQSWRFIKEVITEYFQMKKERNQPNVLNSPGWKGNTPTQPHNHTQSLVQLNSPATAPNMAQRLARQKSEDFNRWRQRSAQQG